MIESDHVLIYGNITISGSQKQEMGLQNQKWNKFSEEKLETFSNILDELQDLEGKMNPLSIQESFQTLYDIIHNAALDTIGKSERVSKHKWKDSKELFELRKQLRRKRSQLRYHKSICNNNDTSITRLANEVWEFRLKVRKMEAIENQIRTESLTNRLSERGPKGLIFIYRFMNDCRRKNHETFILKKDDGNLAFAENEIKLLLDKQLNKIYDIQHWPRAEFAEIPPPQLRISDKSRSLLSQKITISELEYAVSLLKNGKSPGPSDLPSEILKNIPENIRSELTRLCNAMFVEGELPECADTTNMVCLHKKGVTDTLNNYRTLATGCNLLKVFLKILTNRIQQVSGKEELLGNIQHGFRAGYRTTENLLILETGILKMKRSHKEMFVALLDITKAYDRVCRESVVGPLF